MNEERRLERRAGLLLVAILAIAAGLRLYGLFHDLPFSYYGDELHFVKRSMALGSGDLNPHWFHKPAFLMYVLLAGFGTMFMGGRVFGVWESVDAFGASFLTDQGPFLLVGRLIVFAFGMATVWLGWKIGRRTLGTAAGLGAAFVLATLPAMVGGSQVVKADIPSAFFVTAAVWAYLHARGNDRIGPLVAAALLAGASMGTKYYGVIVIPGIVLAEIWSRSERGRSWGSLVGRLALIGGLFVGGFFVTSPYNFLDPVWGDGIRGGLSEFVSVDVPSGAAWAAEEEASATRFDPDSGIEYEPGLGAAPGAAVHFWGRLTNVRALGVGFTVLALLGMVSLARSREGRWDLIVLATPAAVFAFFAVTIMAYHVNARQLNAVFPLLAPLMWPGAAVVAAAVRRFGSRAQTAVALIVFAVASAPMIRHTLEANRAIVQPDSRNVAYRWVLENTTEDERILLDDYGPILVENSAAAARLSARLKAFPGGEAFTGHQGKRLALLREHPADDGRDFDLLGHPWWLSAEIPDEELRASARHRDMGNPLLDRTPRSVAEYREQGFRWIVTNSEARARYDPPGVGQAFPSFRSFYDELATLTPTWTFDPRETHGKGPRVDIYDLRPEPLRRAE